LLLAGQPVRFASPAQALRAVVFLVPGNRRAEGLSLDENVVFNTTLANLGRASLGALLRFGENRRQAAALASKVDLQPPKLDGNQQKVVIAKGLCCQARVYIFVEPTIGVDIGARTRIYALMREIARDAAVIVVSSDCDEAHGVADRTFALSKGAPVALPGREATRDELLSAGIMGRIAA